MNTRRSKVLPINDGPNVDAGVTSVAISHDGQWVVSGSKGPGAQFGDKDGRAQLMLQGHKYSGEWQRCPIYACIPVSNMTSMRAVISIGLSPTGTYLATGSGD
jgi:WD40 repeat protein